MLTTLQYRILRAIAPGEPQVMSGAAYASGGKLQALLGAEWLARLAGRRVIDFGCGAGGEAIELARHGAQVFGIDIRDSVLEEARRRAAEAGVADRCAFGREAPGRADFVVSIDAFEHFDDPGAMLVLMHDLLADGGTVLVSFGPTWYHPLGGHLFSVFPWAHLLFSERALLRWRSHIRDDGATRFREVEGGLNQMTIARFERLVSASPFILERLETVPIRRLAPLHNRLTREFTTAIVRAELRRRPR